MDIWDKKNPVKNHKKLTPEQKAKAKRRAKAAGRPYPNMVDNIFVAKEDYLHERGADSKGYYRSTESGAGLTRKGAKHFGIQTAVTGKVEPGSKAAERRKSFCDRMSGMPGPMKDEKGRPTRKAASLRRWKCRVEDVTTSVMPANRTGPETSTDPTINIKPIITNLIRRKFPKKK